MSYFFQLSRLLLAASDVMGFLEGGRPLTWDESREEAGKESGIPAVQYVREHGIDQFLAIYNKVP